jgi:hypothetical protein
MPNHKNAGSRQQRLRFEIEEIWSALPGPAREGCRSLFKELLASVLKKSERRQDERED